MSAFIAHYQAASSSPALIFNTDSKLENTGMGNEFEAGYTLDDKDGSMQALLTSDRNAIAQLIAVAFLESGIIVNRHVLLRPMSTLFHAN